MSDYKVEIKIKNGRLSILMDERGIANAAELARLVGSFPTAVGHALNLSVTAYNKDGKMRLIYSKLCDYFMCDIEDICPAEHFYTPLYENNKSVYVNKYQLSSLESRSINPMLIASKTDLDFDTMVSSLTDRDARVVKMRFEQDMTFTSIGEVLGVTGCRVRMLYDRALRRLRHPARSEYLVEHLEEIVEY